MNSISQYMKKKNLPYTVQLKVRKYLEYCWNSNQTNLEELDLFNNMSFNLKDEVITYINGSIIKSINLLYYKFTSAFIQKLLFVFEEELFGPDENIFMVFYIIKISLKIILI